MNPHSLQQVTSMAGWLYLLGKIRLSNNKHAFYDLSLDEALAKTCVWIKLAPRFAMSLHLIMLSWTISLGFIALSR